MEKVALIFVFSERKCFHGYFCYLTRLLWIIVILSFSHECPFWRIYLINIHQSIINTSKYVWINSHTNLKEKYWLNLIIPVCLTHNIFTKEYVYHSIISYTQYEKQNNDKSQKTTYFLYVEISFNSVLYCSIWFFEWPLSALLRWI